MQQFSKRLTDEAKKLGIPVQSLLMADLISIGYTENEAYNISYTQNMSLSKQQNIGIKESIVQNPNFQELVSDRASKRNGAAPQMGTANVGTLPSKDEIASIIATEMKSLSGKERVDAAMKLADLFAMKKEEVREETDIVRVWLPLTCSICPYKQKAESANG